MDLRTIPDMAAQWRVPVGLSDHTLSRPRRRSRWRSARRMVEKHLTLRRADGGPDAAFSLEPDEFATLVHAVRDAEASLGRCATARRASERRARVFRRSLFAVADIDAGERLTRDNVRSIRPGRRPRAPPPARVLAGRATTRIRRGTPLRWDHVAQA